MVGPRGAGGRGRAGCGPADLRAAENRLIRVGRGRKGVDHAPNGAPVPDTLQP